MNRQANGSRVSGSLVFLQEFLKHPLQIGSIIPSSRFLERRVVEAAGAADSAVIVELGPGVGGITRALLGAMGPEARLLSIEINPNFHSWVERIGDQRLIAHLGSATDLQEIMAGYALAPPAQWCPASPSRPWTAASARRSSRPCPRCCRPTAALSPTR